MTKPSLLQLAFAGVGGLWPRKRSSKSAGDLGTTGAEREGREAFLLGRAKMRLGDVDEALDAFDRAIEVLPDYGDAVAAKAELLDMLGREPEAAPEYARARRLWAAQRSGAPDRNYVFRQQGRFSFEVEAYELALERIRTGSFPLLACGNVLLAQGRPVEALRQYDRALKLRPGNPNLIAMRGEALSMLGRYRQAIEAFDTALASDPKSPETLNARGIARAALGQLEGANADWRRQLELLPPARPEARACVALRLADYRTALPDLERAASKHPDDPYWRLYLLAAQRRLGIAGEPAGRSYSDAWPAPLLGLHAGTMSADEALKRADTAESRAETAFQLAVVALPDDQAGAIKRWTEVVERGSPVLVEYGAARNELRRLKS